MIHDLFSERDPKRLTRLLQRNGISWVAIDDGLRAEAWAADLAEDVFRETFELAFSDTDGTYGHLAVYRVLPASLSPAAVISSR